MMLPLALRTVSLVLVVCSLATGRAGADAIFGVLPFCPFDFAHGMPAGMFCVYEGVAMDTDGSACSERVQVIWTRLAPDAVPPDDKSGRFSSAYFGFGSNPELVLRANAEDDAGDRAVFADMTSPSSAGPVRIRGSVTLRHVADGSADGTEVLTLRLRRGITIDAGCTLTSFNGTFLGVMTILPDSAEELER